MENPEKTVVLWKSDFGDAYTRRNAVEWATRVPAFRSMLEGVDVRRVLEVGCNRGPNLRALVEVLPPGSEVYGVEPNTYARQLAGEACTKATVLEGQAAALPFEADSFDLVLTAGLLIHVPLADLDRALEEIHRVSRRFILAVEYYAAEETMIPYRGTEGTLFKRDFKAHYQSRFPHLALLRQGYWAPEDGFDRAHWWLLEKP